MYFKQLSKLKDFNIPDDQVNRLDMYLRQVAEKGIWRFSIGLVAKELALDLGTVQGLLLRAAQVGIVQAYFEIECPEGDSDFYVTRLEDVDWNVERRCRVCDVEYVPSPAHIWVTFSIRGYPAPKAVCRL